MNILLVDDQPAKLLSYETVLAELEETLLKADSARAALELLLRHDVAVILIDVCMPELDGFELAQMIRQHPRYVRTPIIFVSAIQVTDLDLLRGYEQGAVDYVPVPVAPALLRAKVRVFVDLHRKTRQLEKFNAELEQRVATRTAELAQANSALERQNLELEQRVEERTQEREAALNRVHQMHKLESLGQLTGGVAHDFNNLLMAIIGHLELLGKRLPDDPRARHLLNGAMQGAERGASLTKRMLAFARQQNLQPEIVDVGRLVGNMLEMVTRSLGPAHPVMTDISADLPSIRVDPNQLELALLNLALNARDALPEGGRITIAARALRPDKLVFRDALADEYVCISVIDTGTGMADATLKRATEPFFTTKNIGKGTGLGLSMVDGLTAQSGGFMRITSEPDKGTAVELFFPRAEAQQDDIAAETAATEEVVAAECRVLLVDDDPLVSTSTAAMLEDLGHSVVPVPSALEGLQILADGIPIDCVVTDHAMPGMTGAEFAAQIRRQWPSMPVIVATGYAETVDLEGLDVLRLAKPFRLRALSDALSQAMARR